MTDDTETQATTRPASRARRGAGPWWRRVLWVLLATMVLFAVVQWATWPDVAALAESDPESTAFIDDHRARTGETPDWRPIPYARIARSLKRAVVASEDMGFFDHDGFAWDEVEIAVRETLEEGKPLRGASTLSQQLVKNLYLSPSRNPWRKVKEALLTMQLERHLSKQRILELYLNVAQLGPDIYGAEAAARRYFGTSAASLGTRQAAMLAASLPNPEDWHPGAGSERHQNRTNRLVGRMREAAWLDKVIP